MGFAKNGNQSLVSRFIQLIVAEHPEPQHRGTPRGEPVGYGKRKVEAAAWMALSGVTEREIAKQLKVSESLLRKWYCEADFKSLMFKHAGEFGQFFTREVRIPAAFAELGGDRQTPPLEIVSPTAEYIIFDEIEAALKKEDATPWAQAALSYVSSFLRAKAIRGAPKKWIYNREPHSKYWSVWQKRKDVSQPTALEEAAHLIREFLYSVMDRRLQQRTLSEYDRKEMRSIVTALRDSEISLARH
jgi:hypothetical protein